METIFHNVTDNLCVMCNTPVDVPRAITCSEKCHEDFIKFAEEKFGTHKKIVDMTSGIEYRVPTRDIVEKGLAWKDLAKYPIWKDEDNT